MRATIILFILFFTAGNLLAQRDLNSRIYSPMRQESILSRIDSIICRYSVLPYQGVQSKVLQDKSVLEHNFLQSTTEALQKNCPEMLFYMGAEMESFSNNMPLEIANEYGIKQYLKAEDFKNGKALLREPGFKAKNDIKIVHKSEKAMIKGERKSSHFNLSNKIHAFAQNSAFAYCFEESDIKAGNIGHLKISGWADAHDLSKQMALNMLGHVAHTQALILDLRGNRNGRPELMAFLASHLIPSDTLMQWGSYYMKGNPDVFSEKEGPFTFPIASLKPKKIENRLLFGTPLYILADEKTAGTSEWLIALLRQHRQVTVIGAGVTHTGGKHYTLRTHRFWETYGLVIPDGLLQPSGGVAWPKEGIKADTVFARKDALEATWQLAFDETMRQTTSVNAKRYYEAHLDYRKASQQQSSPAFDSTAFAQQYAHGFKVSSENGKILLHSGEEVVQFLPLSENHYVSSKLAGYPHESHHGVYGGQHPLVLFPAYMRFIIEGGAPTLVITYWDGSFLTCKKIP